MNQIPNFIAIVFSLTTLLTILFFYKATNYGKSTLIILIIWLGLQATIGLSGYFTVTDTTPPRFILLLLPPLLVIAGLFSTKKGRQYIDDLDLKTLTILSIVRIPVEIVLYWLCIHKTVPELMTFDGRNFDILSGLSAPLIYYFGFIKKQFSNKTILIWNIACLVLLINIVVNAVLSLPTPFQQFGFNQPNIAVLYFPFNWLPSIVVPIVLISHLASIRQLLINHK